MYWNIAKIVIKIKIYFKFFFVSMTDEEEAVENSSNDSLFLSMNQYNLINNDMCTQC
jgi:hypothetical protein